MSNSLFDLSDGIALVVGFSQGSDFALGQARTVMPVSSAVSGFANVHMLQVDGGIAARL